MNCQWKIDGTHEPTGWPIYQCMACPNRTPSPYPPEHIQAQCQRRPHWHEFGEWAALLLTGLRITAAGGCGCGRRKEWLNALGKRFFG